MVAPDFSHVKRVEEVADKLSLNELHLYGMEPRIRTYALADTIYSDISKVYFLTKEHIYIPYRLPSASHEIAHMVEMKDLDRCLLPDWGLKAFTNKVKVSDKLFFAAFAREIRIRAIDNLIHGFSNPVSITNHVYWFHEACKRIPFGRFKDNKDIVAWADDLSLKTFIAWSFDRVEHEWKIRLDHIRNWMETREAA